MAPPTATPHVLLVPFPAQGHALPLYDLAAPRGAGAPPHRRHHAGQRRPARPSPRRAPRLRPPARPPLPLPPFPPRRPREHDELPSRLHRRVHPRARRAPQPHPRVGQVAARAPRRRRRIRLLLRVDATSRRRDRRPEGRLHALRRARHRRAALALSPLVKRPVGCDDGFPVAFPAIPREPAFEWREISMLYKAYIEGLVEEQVGESLKQNCLWNLEGWGFVSNTFRALEGRYLDAPLEDLGFKRVWAVGPVAPDTDAAGERGGEAAVAAGDLSAWLDAFPEGSVVYVCFGSQAVLTPAMAAALAEALERSAVPFVWVVSGDGVVPEGFEARAAAAARGMVVRGWAPKVAALRHAAVGWFMTHCGWNSVLEAVAAGVPMLAWPMAADQFVNARLLVEDAGVALRACAGGAGVAPDAGELAAVLADAVGEKGSGARARAKELAADAAIAVRSGGSSYEDLERFVQEIQKL
uniref:Glycosyltransferase n=1 Tax=Oryza nivara TaxID=4536 RepID=A0A0E0H6P9_ORYNI